MLGQIREGSFLTQSRIRYVALALLCGYAAAILYLLATAHGLSDSAGRPLGSDFSSFHAAGKLALAGRSPYDQAALYRVQQALFGAATPYYAFAYPPIFLLVLEPLARLAYPWALALWLAAGLALYLAAMLALRRRLVPTLDRNPYLLAAIAFPAVFVNLLHGQTGFPAAALFALALVFLEERPWLAGLCFGLLVFKPQLGLLIPFALAAGGRWRVFAGATATVIALGLAALLLFGMESWREFLAATGFARVAILDQNAVGYEKLVSIFAWARLWGAPLWLAYGVQILAAIGVIIATMQLWRGPSDLRLKGAALCLGTLLATPFALDYDMMILAPALTLLAVSNRFLATPYAPSLLALIWLAPILARGFAGSAALPLAAMAMVAGFALVWRAGRLAH